MAYGAYLVRVKKNVFVPLLIVQLGCVVKLDLLIVRSSLEHSNMKCRSRVQLIWASCG